MDSFSHFTTVVLTHIEIFFAVKVSVHSICPEIGSISAAVF